MGAFFEMLLHAAVQVSVKVIFEISSQRAKNFVAGDLYDEGLALLLLARFCVFLIHC